MMSVYNAKIIWNRSSGDSFTEQKYSRAHQWEFDGGVIVPATASHHIVPLPFSKPENVDPEQAFIASLSSCHMLFFLDLASRKKITIEQYVDKATGVLEKDEDNKMAMTVVTLNPVIIFSEDTLPDQEVIEHLHHKAHDLCFIANSVKTKVEINI